MSDTGPAKLPGLFALRSPDQATNAWAQMVNEHLEVRNGARGNPAEKAVVQRDLVALQKQVDMLSVKAAAPLAAAVATPADVVSTDAQQTADIAVLRADLDALSRRAGAAGGTTDLTDLTTRVVKLEAQVAENKGNIALLGTSLGNNWESQSNAWAQITACQQRLNALEAG